MVSETKKQFVQQLVQEIERSPIVGLVNMQNLPAPQLQTMRTTLRAKKVTIVMARKRLLQRALQQSTKKNIQQLAEQLKGMPALLFSQDNPFTLYSIIQKNKSEAPAKAGQTAPKDIMVKAGPTSFAPGPIISELAAVGIKTKVDQGKLAILQDAIIVKEGQVISEKVAETLKRLDIRPMEIGLDLVVVWENGFIFGAKQLHIDEAEYENNFILAAQWAINLAVEAAYCTADTTEMLLQKAFRDAKALALEQDILTDLTAGEVLAKAESQALSLQEEAHLEIPDKPVHPPELVSSTAPPLSTSASSSHKDLPSPLKDVHAYVEHDPHSKSHPKQGTVTGDEAQHLLAKMQKEGTLRGTK
ncbi:50S ribosomal protein L10 [Candidatus Woesearchaeota archaeon]|nr:50S ribosomal protein L10 [Candidatus Woesearchaeota archaeon]